MSSECTTSLAQHQLLAQSAKGRLARAEQALEALLDAQLRSQHHDPQQDDYIDSDGFPANLQDDYVDSDAADTDSCDGQAVHPLHSQVGARQACVGSGLAVKEGANKQCQAEQPVWESVVDDSNPPSFSQVDLSRPEKEIRTRFPMFPVRLLLLLSCSVRCLCLLLGLQLQAAHQSKHMLHPYLSS